MVGLHSFSTSKLIRLGVLTLVALGFALRLYALARESLWYDELLQLEIAQGPLPAIFPRLRGHSAVPLDYVLAHFWLMLGRSEGWLRLPAVAAGTLTLPLAFRLGRSLIGPGAGLLLLALLAASPLHVRFSQEVRPYALVVLGVTLAAFAFWRFRQTGRWRYAAALQVGVLVLTLAHIFATAFLGALLLVAAALVLFRRRRREAGSLAVLAATLVIPAALLLMLGWGDVLRYSAGGFSQALVDVERFEAGPAEKPNRGAGPQVNGEFVKRQVLAPLGAGSAPRALWLLNGLVVAGWLSLWLRRRFAAGLWLGLWLALPVVLIVAFLVYRGAFFAPRYIISVLPAYLLLLAEGVLALPRWLWSWSRRGPWPAAAICLIAGGLVFGLLGEGLGQLYGRRDKEDWRLVGEFINRNAGPNDAVIAVKAEPVINWYYPRAHATPNYYDQLERIQAAAAGAERSWVILSIFSSGVDARVKAWLGEGEQGAIRLALDPAIAVYYLGRSASREQLLAEIQGFALPVNHELYASLARENRRRPDVARQYYRLAIEHAPSEAVRAEYRQALEALP